MISGFEESQFVIHYELWTVNMRDCNRAGLIIWYRDKDRARLLCWKTQGQGGLMHLTAEGRRPEAVRCIRPPEAFGCQHSSLTRS